MAQNNKSIAQKYDSIRDSIEESLSKSGRQGEKIHIIAVTKTFPLETLQETIDQNILELGENKVQEVVQKIPNLKGNFIAHFIGNIQRNKIKQVIQHISIYHSIIKEETALSFEKEIQKLHDNNLVPQLNSGYLNIPPGKIGFFIQVNTTEEETKSGIHPHEALFLAEKLAKMNHLLPLGLMTIGPTNGSSLENRKAFATLFNLKEELARKVSDKYRYLSMGMSSDYQDAIMEGATHLRIGSAIFGKRSYA